MLSRRVAPGRRCGLPQLSWHRGLPTASLHSQRQVKVTHHSPALAQLGSAGPAAWGCQGRSASQLVLRPREPGAGSRRSRAMLRWLWEGCGTPHLPCRHSAHGYDQA